MRIKAASPQEREQLEGALQQAYLRALATLPGFDAYYGVFRSGVKRRPLAEPVTGLPSYVLVRDSEEKGSDVNLATRLLVDGFNGECEQAVVVSNDLASRTGAGAQTGASTGSSTSSTAHAGRRRRPSSRSRAARYPRR